jgi:hypothetical protein
MEGDTPREGAQDGRPPAGRKGWRWRDGASLLVLLLLAGGIRTWLFCHTEVAARDSIGFIRIAWQLEHRSWVDVLKQSEQHPGYPVLLLAVSVPVRQVLHGPEAVVMQFSAQLTSVLAGTLLVIPMFYLGRELFGRTVGFWASVLIQVLPASCRVLSDGLSEATFLLFTATALYLAVRGLRGRSPVWFALCGLAGAMAYLTRPEGALLVGATAAVLVAAQWVPRWRRPWRSFAACAASLAVVAVAAGSPIYLATGHSTVKPTPNRLFKTLGGEGASDEPVRDGPEFSARATGGGALRAGPPVFASLLAVWEYDPQGPKGYGHRVWGLWAVGHELNKGFHYATWLSALLGLWWCRSRFHRVPGTWVLLLLSVAVVVLRWWVAARMGYLSDRHLLLVILCGTYCAAAGVAALGERLARMLGSWVPALALGLGPRAHGRLVMLLLLAGLVGSALPKALEPLHLARGGFRGAGLWLAEHAHPADAIFDPYTWSSYYAGRAFQDKVPPPPGYQPLEYVVVDESGNPHPHLAKHEKAKRLARRATEVYRLQGRHKDTLNIAIYALPLPPEPRHLTP